MSPEARPNNATFDQVITRPTGQEFRQLAAKYRVTEAMTRDFIAFIPVGTFATNDEIINHLFPDNGAHLNKPSKLRATANLLLVNTVITSRKRKKGSEYHHVKLTDLPALKRKWEAEKKLQQTKMPLIEGRLGPYLDFLPLGASATSFEIVTHFHPGKENGFKTEPSRYKRAANKALADRGEMVVEHNSTYYHIRTEELPALQVEWEEERKQREKEANAKRIRRNQENLAAETPFVPSESQVYYMACFSKNMQYVMNQRTQYVPSNETREVWDKTIAENQDHAQSTNPLGVIKEVANILDKMNTLQYMQFRSQYLPYIEAFETNGMGAGRNIKAILKEFKQHS